MTRKPLSQPPGTDYVLAQDATDVQSLANALRRNNPDLSAMQAHLAAVRLYGQVQR